MVSDLTAGGPRKSLKPSLLVLVEQDELLTSFFSDPARSTCSGENDHRPRDKSPAEAALGSQKADCLRQCL